MKKIVIIVLLGLVISCGEKNYSKMSIEKLDSEIGKYNEKIMNGISTHEEDLEAYKIGVILEKKVLGNKYSENDHKGKVDMKKGIDKMSVEELNSFIAIEENKLYEKGNLSNEEIEKIQSAYKAREQRMYESTKEMWDKALKN